MRTVAALLVAAAFVPAHAATVLTGTWQAGMPPFGGYDTIAQWCAANKASCAGHCNGINSLPSGATYDVQAFYNSDSLTATATCTVNTPCESGGLAASGYVGIGSSPGARPPLMPCIDGCSAMVQDLTSPAGSALVNGQKQYYAHGSYTKTGGSCEANASNTIEAVPAVPEDSCAVGQAKGTVNGKTVCVNQSGSSATLEGEKGTTVTTTSVSTSVAADGSSSKITEAVTSNADGSSSKTTTLSTYDASGNLTGSKVTSYLSNPDGSIGQGGTTGGQANGCETNSSGAGCGGEATQIDALYEKKPETLQQVFDARKSEFMASPVGTAVGSFFNVSGGGSCPTWQATIPWINAQMVIDQWCAPFVTNNLGVIRAVILCCAGFFAFRVAVE